MASVSMCLARRPAAALGLRSLARHPAMSRRLATTVQATAEPMSAEGMPPPKAIYGQWTVYKAKGALAVKLLGPKWTETETAFTMDRSGSLMMELAASRGERVYNWEEKIQVSLKAEELGAILADPKGDHTFYHDTFKGQPGREGTLVKQLRWSLAPDGNAYYVNAKMDDKKANITRQASVSLSHGEFYVFQQLVNASMLYMLGWDALLAQPNISDKN